MAGKAAKVVLVNPNYCKVYSKVSSARGISPPIGLAYIAAYLRKNGVDVSIFDANALELTRDQVVDKLPKDCDIVGVPSFTPSLDAAVDILNIAKELNPSCKTVMGGAHISALPIETLNVHERIDFGIIGEGENTILDLVRALETNTDISQVKGLVYRKNGAVKMNEPRDLIKDLDKLPFPAVDLLPMDKYRLPVHHAYLNKDVAKGSSFLLCTSRGCPYNCTYCSSKVTWGRGIRFRSKQNVLEEIDLLVNKHKVRVLDIDDDIFTIKKERLHGILNALIERNYDLHFTCLSRVDSINKQDLVKLKKAGCYLLRFGVESGSNYMLKLMRKGITVEQTRAAFRLTRDAGIATSATFVIGHPGETVETARKTIELAKEINPAICHFYIATPYVGTELFEIAERKGLITDMNWENWCLMSEKPVLRTEDLSEEDLVGLRKRAYREFYLRPSYILRNLVKIRNLGQIRLYRDGFMAAIGMLKR